MQAVPTASKQTIAEFFELIYGDQDGYSYSPYKDPNIVGDWTQCWFKWPEEKEQLVKHVAVLSQTNDVYYSPALFAEPDALKGKVKSTRVLWAEFDGEVPHELGPIPQPSIKIQSSTKGHEHWYWLLDFPLSNIEAAETLIRRITYATGADFCWNANRVLRPTGTTHQHSGRTVREIFKSSRTYSPGDLVSIPEIPTELSSFSVGAVPHFTDVVAKYKWSKEDWEFFKKPEQREGSRSSALARLALCGTEMGMQNGEIYAILDAADIRWKKFVDRNDRKDRLLGLIRYARVKKAKAAVTSNKNAFVVYGFREFIEKEDVKLQWVVKDLIAKGTGIVMGSEGGLGKTQIAMQAAIHMALGKDFIGWKMSEERQKILMLSLEMTAAGLDYFMQNMFKGLTEEEVDVLQENFIVLPLGEQLRFDNLEEQAKLNELLQRVKPTGVIVDSLGRAIGGNINSDEAVLNVFRYVDSFIKKPFDAFCWFIHHTRKPQVGNKRPTRLGDLYGNQYIGAWPETAFALWGTGEEIELSTTKNRLGPQPPAKFIKRTQNLNFMVTRVRTGKKETDTTPTPDGDEFLNF